jgi:hypothetical protein
MTCTSKVRCWRFQRTARPTHIHPATTPTHPTAYDQYELAVKPCNCWADGNCSTDAHGLPHALGYHQPSFNAQHRLVKSYECSGFDPGNLRLVKSCECNLRRCGWVFGKERDPEQAKHYRGLYARRMTGIDGGKTWPASLKSDDLEYMTMGLLEEHLDSPQEEEDSWSL